MWGNEEVGGLHRATLASMQAETDYLRSEVESYKLGRANSGGGAISWVELTKWECVYLSSASVRVVDEGCVKVWTALTSS